MEMEDRKGCQRWDPDASVPKCRVIRETEDSMNALLMLCEYSDIISTPVEWQGGGGTTRVHQEQSKYNVAGCLGFHLPLSIPSGMPSPN